MDIILVKVGDRAPIFYAHELPDRMSAQEGIDRLGSHYEGKDFAAQVLRFQRVHVDPMPDA